MASDERFQGANSIEAGTLSPYWGEHVARYFFALPHVKNQVVLDIACGTGYGIGLLKTEAKYVVGVDIDIAAAMDAKKECDETASVMLGSGLSIPFADDSFDVITSFETLEHLHDRTGFLSELKRVLKPTGTLFLSTPNSNYTMPVDGIPTNPFHVFEYSPEELTTELEQHFSVKQFLGQGLDSKIRIPPFYDAQLRMPKDLATQVPLFFWKVMNHVPRPLRESLSGLIWKKPFYPTPDDYIFASDTVQTAPVLVAVCK